MLRVAVSSAVNLPNVETIGKSDPYVVLTFQGLYLVYFISFVECFEVFYRPEVGTSAGNNNSAC